MYGMYNRYGHESIYQLCDRTKKRACSWRSCSRTRSARIPSYCTSATPNQIETPLRNRSETPEGGAYVNTSCQVLSDLCQTNKTVRARTHVHGSSQTHFREVPQRRKAPNTDCYPEHGSVSSEVLQGRSRERSNLSTTTNNPLHTCTEAAPLPCGTSDPPRRPVRCQEVDAGSR